MRALPAIFVLSTAVFCATRAVAQSQPWLGDRRLGGGIGVRAGNFELHPGIAGEVGYDSNFYQGAGRVTPAGQMVLIEPQFQPRSANGATIGNGGFFNEPSTGVLRFRVTPSLTLKTLGPQRTQGDGAGATPPKVSFSAEISASYNELIATDSNYSDEVQDDRFLSTELSANAQILPQRPWGATLTGGFSREVQPVNDPALPPRFARDIFRAGAALNWRPGGGMLDWSLGYAMTYVMFESGDFSNFSSISHSAVLKGRWLFLPRTALLYWGDYGVLVYPNGGNVKSRGAPLSSRLGINGLITNHFAALAVIGWKSMFFEQNGSFDSVVGNAELTWYPLPRPDLAPDAAAVGLSAITVGYRRDASASYLGNYVQTDGGYAKSSYFFAGMFLVTLEAGIDHLQRSPSYFSNQARQSGPFSENRVNVTGFAEYRTSDTFGINTTLRYSANMTDQIIPVSTNPANDGYDDLSFDRIEAWLGVRWFL
ncbi:MAG: hypothetical protein ABI895_06010 [Deltaproteobacteria bacterium]